MNSKVMDKNGFSYVTCKRKRKKKRHLKAKHVPVSPQNFEAVMRNIQDELKCSDFIVTFKQDLLVALDVLGKFSFSSDMKEDIDIVCYGLGRFSFCAIARYQLGFLLLLKDIVNSTNIYIYDPQFSVEEVSFLKDLGMNVLSVNEEAKRQSNGKTIYFMPHCHLPLYNNLLWANWSVKNLSELIIIGNSFENYLFNDARCRLKEKTKYVYYANKFVTEISIVNSFHFSDIFNDLSIHYFNFNSASVHPKVWTNVHEPQYSDDEGIIKKS